MPFSNFDEKKYHEWEKENKERALRELNKFIGYLPPTLAEIGVVKETLKAMETGKYFSPFTFLDIGVRLIENKKYQDALDLIKAVHRIRQDFAPEASRFLWKMPEKSIIEKYFHFLVPKITPESKHWRAELWGIIYHMFPPWAIHTFITDRKEEYEFPYPFCNCMFNEKLKDSEYEFMKGMCDAIFMNFQNIIFNIEGIEFSEELGHLERSDIDTLMERIVFVNSVIGDWKQIEEILQKYPFKDFFKQRMLSALFDHYLRTGDLDSALDCANKIMDKYLSLEGVDEKQVKIFFSTLLAQKGGLAAVGKPEKVAEKSKCLSCGEEIDDNGWNFCPYCKRGLKAKNCSTCGMELKAEWKICPKCGK